MLIAPGFLGPFYPFYLYGIANFKRVMASSIKSTKCMTQLQGMFYRLNPYTKLPKMVNWFASQPANSDWYL